MGGKFIDALHFGHGLKDDPVDHPKIKVRKPIVFEG